MIRKYKPDDLANIMDIGNRAWREIYKMFREAYGDELFQTIVPNETTTKGEQIKSHCKRHPGWVFICEEEERIVGFISFTLNSDTRIGEIGNNAKDPNCSLKGIGQQMYKAHTGLDYAHAPARRAYERAGFNLHHEDVDYFMKL
jgi:hypothetical protein